MDPSGVLHLLHGCLMQLSTNLELLDSKKYGGKPNAYVTLVMKGDFYVPGALVLANSLRQTGTQSDIVCMVTDDVSSKAREALGGVFDKVVSIQYISEPYTHLNTAKEENMYHHWMKDSLTLYRCLWLFEYNKVCLLDSDVLVLRNMDSVFDLPAPAGSFHSFWLKGSHNPYPHDLRHGDPVPIESIKEALRMQNSFVCIGNCLLLPPREDIANAFLSYINDFVSKNKALGFDRCNSGANEQTIAHFFACRMAMQWTHIGTQYQCIPWKYSPYDKEGAPFLFHYFNIKPWTMDIHEFPDLQVWWASAKAVCDAHPTAIDFFPAGNRANLSPKIGSIRTKKCLWCKGHHEFIDFASNRITCPKIASNTTTPY